MQVEKKIDKVVKMFEIQIFVTLKHNIFFLGCKALRKLLFLNIFFLIKMKYSSMCTYFSKYLICSG